MSSLIPPPSLSLPKDLFFLHCHHYSEPLSHLYLLIDLYHFAFLQHNLYSGPSFCDQSLNICVPQGSSLVTFFFFSSRISWIISTKALTLMTTYKLINLYLQPGSVSDLPPQTHTYTSPSPLLLISLKSITIIQLLQTCVSALTTNTDT